LWTLPVADPQKREGTRAVRLDGDDAGDHAFRWRAAAVRHRLPAPRLGTGGPA
jgi:hypothetical protein